MILYTEITELCKSVIGRSSRNFAASFYAGESKYSDIKSLKVSVPSVANGQISIGGTISKSVEIIVEKADILPGTKINVYEGVKLDSGAYEDVRMGEFKIRSAVSKGSLTTIIAEGPLSTETSLGYFSELTYPATTIQILEEISAKIGVPIVTDNLEEIYVESPPEGYTYREVIGYIAGMHGTNAFEMRDGSVALKWYEASKEDIFTDKADTPELSNSTFTVELFKCETGDTTITRGEGITGITISNPLMTEAATDILWAKVAGFSYRPATFNIKSGTPLIDEWNYFSYGGENVIATELEFIHDGGLQNTFKSAGESESTGNYEGPTTTALKRYQAELAIVKEVVAGKISAEEADLLYAKIDQLDVIEMNITSAVVGTIDGKYATFDFVTSNYTSTVVFDALSGRVVDLETYALTADSGIIKDLQAEVTRTNTLIFGSATGTSIHSSFSNAVVAQIGDAQIKSAMIESVSASKVTAGDIVTNKVRVVSEDGRLLISDETIQISDATRVRVQIGKDANSDYNMYVWDKSGNIMFDALGLTEAGITRQIIRNDMVSDTANISASKLDIDSLFTEINGSTNTIKSTKIYLDEQGQTLDLAFVSMSTTVGKLGDTQTSQGTAISTIQGQINSKIWQEDITTAVDSLEIGGRNLVLGTDYLCKWTNQNTVSAGETFYLASKHLPGLVNKTITFSFWLHSIGERQINESAATTMANRFGCHLTIHWTDSTGTLTSTRTEYPCIMLTNVVERSRVSMTYTLTPPTGYDTITTLAITMQMYARPADTNTETWEIGYPKLEIGNVATDWTPAPEDTEADISTLSTQYSEINQTVNSIVTTIVSHDSELSDLGTRVSTSESNYTQLSNKFNWIVKSGTSASDFTITDRMATLTAQYINLNGLVTFSGLGADAQSAIADAQTTANSALTTANAASTNASSALTKAESALTAANANDAVIAAWCYNNNTTWIDGGKIYAGTITAKQIDVEELFAQDITAGGSIELIGETEEMSKLAVKSKESSACSMIMPIGMICRDENGVNRIEMRAYYDDAYLEVIGDEAFVSIRGGMMEVNGNDGYSYMTETYICTSGTVKTAELIVSGEITAPNLLLQVYPVGAIYISTVSTSPATLFGGTWTQITNRFLVAAGSSYTAGSTGGATTHTHGLTAGYAKIHHDSGYFWFAEKTVSTKWTDTGKASATGSSSSTNNAYAIELAGNTDSGSTLPPYLAVYVWKRIA